MRMVSYNIKFKKMTDEPTLKVKVFCFQQSLMLEIEESGTYTVTVTGEKAKGNVKFLS